MLFDMQDMRPPTREDIDATRGLLMLEFGAAWCGICRSMAPLIAKAAREHSDVRHVKVEDAAGEALGRSFGIKLWPTLVFLRDGREVARVVRPHSEQEILAAFEQLLDSPAEGETGMPDLPDVGAYQGARRGFGGGRYAAAYSGSYGGEFRDDYRGIRSEGSGRFGADAKRGAHSDKDKDKDKVGGK
jgi:thioredoxin 1